MWRNWNSIISPAVSGEVNFALLSDWTDSAAEHAGDDAPLLAAAIAGIARLNRLYGPAPGGARFLLLHRHRVWNAGEGRWIGWERKRGKLHELNRLLRGASDTTFLDPPPVPAGVRYVVSLDADTRLPHDAVRRLVGKMAHPLNAPRLDPALGRVMEGHAVLQPRVTPSLPTGRGSTLFQRVFSSMDGIDPYAGAVSDVYQDVFGEGSYAGKGIYDVDAFDAALHGRVADSTLLSHDLFEGVFARAALASDIEVVEEFPTGYAVAAMRQHRWARGDWQLLPWIAPRRGRPARDALPAMGYWKMLDNLRRTLSAPAGVAALLAGWLLPLPAARDLDRVRAADDRLAGDAACFRGHGARRALGIAALLPGRSARRDTPCRVAGRPRHRVPGAPGRAHGRCDRPDTPARLLDAPPFAAMGHRGAGSRTGRR